jgi:hypothetical protein
MPLAGVSGLRSEGRVRKLIMVGSKSWAFAWAGQPLHSGRSCTYAAELAHPGTQTLPLAYFSASSRTSEDVIKCVGTMAADRRF